MTDTVTWVLIFIILAQMVVIAVQGGWLKGMVSLQNAADLMEAAKQHAAETPEKYDDLITNVASDILSKVIAGSGTTTAQVTVQKKE